MIRQLLFTLFLCCHFSMPTQAQTWSALPEKKLIEYGWDLPEPAFIAAHIREMEKRPFDGIVFKLSGGANVFETKMRDMTAYAQEIETLKAIQWEKFTDNFVVMLAASDQDWFDDTQWVNIVANVRLVGKAAKAGRCVGVCLDPEPYGPNPWSFKKAAHASEKTFADYEAQVRKRGVEFINALQQEFPSPKILSFYLIGLFERMAAVDRAARLATHDYELYPAFVAGMLENADDGMEFIDGNESAYYYSEYASYLLDHTRAKSEGTMFFPQELWPAYRLHVRMGQALYMDQYYGLRTMKVPGNYLSPEDQNKWFEHNVYWAMRSSDEYVWCYSERLNWWTDTDIPAGSADAIRSGREKAANLSPLGFDITPAMTAARAKMNTDTK